MSLLVGLVALLLLIALTGTADAQRSRRLPKHLRVKGDPTRKLKLARGWNPPPVTRAEGTERVVITSAPLWCSATARRKGYDAKEGALPPRPERIADRRAVQMLGWLRDQAKADPIVVATPHMVLIVCLPPASDIKLGPREKTWLKEYYPKLGRKLTKEQRAVLYGLRYLHFEARFLDLLGCLEGSPGQLSSPPDAHLGAQGRAEIYIFAKRLSYIQFGRHFFKGFGYFTSYWQNHKADGAVGVMSVETLPDNQIHARLDHVAAQTLFMQYRGYRHFLPGWVGCGLSHFFERRHNRVPDTFGTTGGLMVAVHWKDDWKKELKEAVFLGAYTPIGTLCEIMWEGKLTPLQHAQSWSLTTFLVALGRERLRTCIEELKIRGKDETLTDMQFRAVKKAYGTDLVTLERAWLAWVRKTY